MPYATYVNQSQYADQGEIIKVGLEENGLGTAKNRNFDGMTKTKNYGCTNDTTSAPAEIRKTTTISPYPTWQYCQITGACGISGLKIHCFWGVQWRFL